MKYVPNHIPDEMEELPRLLNEELWRIAASVDINRQEYSHIHVDSAYSAGEVPYVFADATGGAFTVKLPAPVDEMILTIKKVDSSVNLVTVDAGANNIDGASTYTGLASQYDVVSVYWDATSSEWRIV